MEAKCLDTFYVGELIQLVGHSAVPGLVKVHFNS